MKKIWGSAFVSLACLLMLGACATRDGIEDIERTDSQSQKILRENEIRLSNLENSISSLNNQVAQLNNRVYEVRTKNGQRTSMTVVPVGAGHTSSQPKAVAQPQKTPTAKRINPAAKPAALTGATQRKPVAPAKPATPAPDAQASGSLGQPERTAGPSGSLAASNDDLSLPPSEIDVPVPSSNTYSGNTISAHANTGIDNNAETVVPVPLIPPSDLSLPPEQPMAPQSIPDIPSAQTQSASVPAATPPPAPKATPRTQAGEEAAYQTALRAARSGKTTEGIRLFREFLQKYPNGRYTANADYWLGECLYAQGKYQDALSQFQTVNNSYPSHHKNADALLKAGLTLNKMGNKTGAQEKFRQVLTSFPNSDAAKRVRSMGIR